jgi:DNA-binding response OmpR family regulator
METRLKAYDAGGSDYICKPYSRAELIRKVKVAEEDFHRHQGIMMRAEVAQQAAFSAISNLGETGILFDFLRKSHTTETVDELAATIRKAVKDFGLNTLLELRHQGKNLYYSDNPTCTPLEQAILEHAHNKGRVVWVRECLVVNYDLITMVISGFDQSDEALVGRQRDHLAFIAEASNSRIESLTYDNGWLLQVRAAMQDFKALCDSLSVIQHTQLDLINQALADSENFATHIESMLQDIELDELQRLVLNDEAQRSAKAINEYLHQESVLNEQLSDLIIKFGKISVIH